MMIKQYLIRLVSNNFFNRSSEFECTHVIKREFREELRRYMSENRSYKCGRFERKQYNM